jgi:hypothetical protein
MGTADVRRTAADVTSCPARRNANETESRYVTASKQLVATRTAFSQKPFRQQGFVHNLSLHSPPVDPLVCPTRRPTPHPFYLDSANSIQSLSKWRRLTPPTILCK